MPFIIIVGQPSTGKTTVCNKIRDYFLQKSKSVEVVSEFEVLQQKQLTRNTAYADSKIEKEIRGVLKTQVFRKLHPDVVLILDGLNYIKGFRYELYCGSKENKTTSCTVHCDISAENAWQLNQSRAAEEQYSKEVFDGLVLRYEVPDSRNRWDSPMVTVIDVEKIPFEDVEAALYSRKPPPPNLATQCPPLSDTNFLHQVDKSVQAVVGNIVAATKMGQEGDISVPGTDEKILLSSEKNFSLPQLMRLKRQFIIYVKSHPEISSQNVAQFFVQYLNTNV